MPALYRSCVLDEFTGDVGEDDGTLVRHDDALLRVLLQMAGWLRWGRMLAG